MLKRKNECEFWFFIIFNFFYYFQTFGSCSDLSLFASTTSSPSIIETVTIINDSYSISENYSFDATENVLSSSQPSSPEVANFVTNKDNLINSHEKVFEDNTNNSVLITSSANNFSTGITSDLLRISQDDSSTKHEVLNTQENSYNTKEYFVTSTELSNIIGQKNINLSTIPQSNNLVPLVNGTRNYHDAFSTLLIISGAFNPFFKSLHYNYSTSSNSNEVFKNSTVFSSENFFKKTSSCFPCTMVSQTDESLSVSNNFTTEANLGSSASPNSYSESQYGEPLFDERTSKETAVLRNTHPHLNISTVVPYLNPVDTSIDESQSNKSNVSAIDMKYKSEEIYSSNNQITFYNSSPSSEPVMNTNNIAEIPKTTDSAYFTFYQENKTETPSVNLYSIGTSPKNKTQHTTTPLDTYGEAKITHNEHAVTPKEKINFQNGYTNKDSNISVETVPLENIQSVHRFTTFDFNIRTPSPYTSSSLSNLITDETSTAPNSRLTKELTLLITNNPTGQDPSSTSPQELSNPDCSVDTSDGSTPVNCITVSSKYTTGRTISTLPLFPNISQTGEEYASTQPTELTESEELEYNINDPTVSNRFAVSDEVYSSSTSSIQDLSEYESPRDEGSTSTPTSNLRQFDNISSSADSSVAYEHTTRTDQHIFISNTNPIHYSSLYSLIGSLDSTTPLTPGHSLADNFTSKPIESANYSKRTTVSDQYISNRTISAEVSSFQTTIWNEEPVTPPALEFKQPSNITSVSNSETAYTFTSLSDVYISGNPSPTQDSSLNKLTWDEKSTTTPKMKLGKTENQTSTISSTDSSNNKYASSEGVFFSSTFKNIQSSIPLSTTDDGIVYDSTTTKSAEYISTSSSPTQHSPFYKITELTITPTSSSFVHSNNLIPSIDYAAVHKEVTEPDKYIPGNRIPLSSIHNTTHSPGMVKLRTPGNSLANDLTTTMDAVEDNNDNISSSKTERYVSKSPTPTNDFSLNPATSELESNTTWNTEATTSDSVTYGTNSSAIHRWITLSYRVTSTSTTTTPSSTTTNKTSSQWKTEATQKDISSSPTPVNVFPNKNIPSISTLASDPEGSTTDNLKRIFWYWRPTRYPSVTTPWRPSSTSTWKPSSTAADDVENYVEYASTQSTDYDSTTPPLEGVEELQYSVYWNVPTFQCHKYGLNFSSVSEWGIEQNFMDEFRGEAISILYDPGEFPALLPASGSSRVSRNGGVPQEGSLTRHLTLFAAHLDKLIPDTQFKGLGIIDFEHWRPVWRQNWGSLAVYRDYSRHIERRRHPFWFSSMIEMEAKFKYELAARTFILETLRMAKRLRPMAKWGYYGYPFCFNYTPYNNRASCSYETSRDNDGMAWMFDEETSHYPSLYLKENDMYTWKRRKFVEGRLDESMRVAKDIPVFPYIWYKYHDTDRFLSQADMLEVLKRPMLKGCPGVVIWGASRDVNTREKCHSLARYLDEVIGPIVLELKTGLRADLYDETTPINEEDEEDDTEDEEEDDDDEDERRKKIRKIG